MHSEIQTPIQGKCNANYKYVTWLHHKAIQATIYLRGGLCVNCQNCKRLLPRPCAKKSFEREIWQNVRHCGCPFGAELLALPLSHDSESVGVRNQCVRVHIHEEH